MFHIRECIINVIPKKLSSPFRPKVIAGTFADAKPAVLVLALTFAIKFAPGREPMPS